MKGAKDINAAHLSSSCNDFPLQMESIWVEQTETSSIILKTHSWKDLC